jgi:hypothetical protein
MQANRILLIEISSRINDKIYHDFVEYCKTDVSITDKIITHVKEMNQDHFDHEDEITDIEIATMMDKCVLKQLIKGDLCRGNYFYMDTHDRRNEDREKFVNINLK